MRVTVLGSGPSGGVPLPGCACPVCRSPNPRNRRRRVSILVEEGATRLLVDASPDLRAQLLDLDDVRLDAVIFTHAHADHCHGIDDLRAVNHRNDAPLDAFALPETLQTLDARFGYVFEPVRPGFGWYKPQLIPRAVDGLFRVGDITVTPFEQGHGRGTTLGLRFGRFAYSTDVNALTDAAFDTLAGIDAWLVDCLRPKPNPMHSHLPQTLEWIVRVAPERAYLTHMNHELDYDALSATLPPGTAPAYDGLVIEV